MNIQVIHSHRCAICNNQCIDNDTHRSKEKGCESCGGMFFICGHCNGNDCPECGKKLKEKNDIFPYNLFKAIREDDIDKIHTLLFNHFLNINEVTDEKGYLPIICAAIGQNLTICEALIHKYGASVVQQTKYGRTALIEMVRCRSDKWNNKVAELCSNSVNLQDNDGRTALMFAAQGAGLFGSKKGNIKIATQLINMGADTTMVDKLGRTALKWAIESNKQSKTSNNEEMVNFLKEQMINQIAITEFRKNYAYEFTDKGILIFHKK